MDVLEELEVDFQYIVDFNFDNETRKSDDENDSDYMDLARTERVNRMLPYNENRMIFFFSIFFTTLNLCKHFVSTEPEFSI